MEGVLSGETYKEEGKQERTGDGADQECSLRWSWPDPQRGSGAQTAPQGCFGLKAIGQDCFTLYQSVFDPRGRRRGRETLHSLPGETVSIS